MRRAEGVMVGRALVVWIGILLLASLNGAVRDLLLAPRLGDTIARALSTVILCLVVAAVTWPSVGWIGPSSTARALAVGACWVALTLAFEFVGGHYLFHKPWSTLLADYDVSRGRIWVAVLVVTFLAPLWAARGRGLV